MICPWCGATSPGSQPFCGTCGRSLAGPPPAPPPPEFPAAPAQSYPPMGPLQPSGGTTKRNGLVAALILIALLALLAGGVFLYLKGRMTQGEPSNPFSGAAPTYSSSLVDRTICGRGSGSEGQTFLLSSAPHSEPGVRDEG